MPNDQTRELSTRSIRVRFETLDDDARTVEAVLTTEDPVPMYGAHEILLMTGMKAPAQIPMLDTHSRWSIEDIVGSVSEIKTDGPAALGKLSFATTARADTAWALARDGHLTDVSVGYRIGDDYITIEPKQSAVVKGRKFTAPDNARLRVVPNWELKELSLVPIGADPKAKLREQAIGGAAAGNARKEQSMADKEKDVAAEQRAAAAQALEVPESDFVRFNVEIDTDEVKEVATKAVDEALRAERNRVNRLRAMGKEYEVPAEAVERAIADGLTEAQAADSFLKAIREERKSPASVSVHDNTEDMIRDLSDAVCVRAGVKPENASGQKAAEQFKGMGLRDLARFCINHEGRTGSFGGVDAEFRAAVSTSSFTSVLYEANTKVFQNTLNQYPATSPLWTASREVPDFRTGYEVQLSEDNGVLPQLPTSGEFKHTLFTDSKESMSVLTYGETFVLDRKRYINDDLGVLLQQCPQRMARKAARLPDDLVYSVLVSNSGVGPTMGEDGYNLFSTSHSPAANYVASSTYVLGDTGLAYLDKLMGLIKGLGAGTSDPPLGLQAKTLLVPKTLATTAMKWLNSAFIMASGLASTSSYTVDGTANIWKGAYNLVVEPRLDAATNGTTAWYLVADPMDMPSIVRVYLRGATTPTLERSDPVNVLGIGWRCYWDVGAAAVNWRGICRSRGA